MEELDLQKFGTHVRKFRKQRGISQETFAERIGCSTTHVSYIENGIRSVSMEMFVLIANTLHVSADDLLQDSLETRTNAVNHIFADMTQDCTNYEKSVLTDVVRAVKKSLRQNKGLG